MIEVKHYFLTIFLISIAFSISCDKPFDEGRYGRLSACRATLKGLGFYIKAYNIDKGNSLWEEDIKPDALFKSLFEYIKFSFGAVSGDSFRCPGSNMDIREDFHRSSIPDMSKEELNYIIKNRDKYISYIFRVKAAPDNSDKKAFPIFADERLSYHKPYVNVLYSDRRVRPVKGKSVSEIIEKEPALGNGTFNKNLKP